LCMSVRVCVAWIGRSFRGGWLVVGHDEVGAEWRDGA
jgi:hypothetical protein